MAKKFYVVWQGRQTGIFTDWASCKKQIDRFPGARYKSFPSTVQAEAAFAGDRAAKAKTATSRSAMTKPIGKRPGANGVKTFSAAEIAALPLDTLIFTDGGCDPNPGKAGSGVAVYRDDRLAELWYGLYNPAGTNNTAELNALHQALLMAEQEIKQGRSVAIFCDSKYSIQCITQWAVSWQKKGWKRPGGEIKNLPLIQQMFALHQTLKTHVSVLHVNGHVGVEGNELADRMSILAIQRRDLAFRRYGTTDGESFDIAAVLAMRAG